MINRQTLVSFNGGLPREIASWRPTTLVGDSFIRSVYPTNFKNRPPKNHKKIKIALISALLDASSQHIRALLTFRVVVENWSAVEVRLLLVRAAKKASPRIARLGTQRRNGNPSDRRWPWTNSSMVQAELALYKDIIGTHVVPIRRGYIEHSTSGA